MFKTQDLNSVVTGSLIGPWILQVFRWLAASSTSASVCHF